MTLLRNSNGFEKMKSQTFDKGMYAGALPAIARSDIWGVYQAAQCKVTGNGRSDDWMGSLESLTTMGL